MNHRLTIISNFQMVTCKRVEIRLYLILTIRHTINFLPVFCFIFCESLLYALYIYTFPHRILHNCFLFIFLLINLFTGTERTSFLRGINVFTTTL